MRIGIDLDEVGYPFVDELREAAVRLGVADRHTMPAASCWEFYDKDWGWTTAQFKRVLADAISMCGMYEGGLPIRGFVEGMQDLKEMGHSLHVVTDRAGFGWPGHAVSATHRWLHDNSIPFDSLTFAGDKTIARVDLHLDDAPHHYHALLAAGTPCYLYTADHNMHVATLGDHRVWGFHDFVRRVVALDDKEIAA